MAAIPIQISGVLYDKTARTQRPVYLVGEASIVGVSVGGGPIIPVDEVPPDTGGPGDGPPPHVEFPIWGPPGIELPPGSGYPPVAGHPLPPIPPGTEPPKPIIGWEAKIVWSPDNGWAVVVVPKDDTLVPTPSK